MLSLIGNEDMCQVVIVPSGMVALGLDAARTGLLLLQEVQGNMTQNCHVFRAVLFSDPTGVFVHTHI